MSKIRNHYNVMLSHILIGSGLGAAWAVLVLSILTLWNQGLSAGLSEAVVARAEFGLWAGGMAGALGGLIVTLAFHGTEIDEQPIADVGRLFGGAALSLCLLLGMLAWVLEPTIGLFLQSSFANVLSKSPMLVAAVSTAVLFGPALLAAQVMAKGQKNKLNAAHHLRYSPITKKMGFEVTTG